MPAYTYTASASVVDHVGATIKMVDIRPAAYSDNDGSDHQDFEDGYEKLAEAITEKTKVTCLLTLPVFAPMWRKS